MFANQGQAVFGGDVSVDLVIDHDDGSEAAGTDTAERAEKELAVRGALAFGDVQTTLELVEHLRRPLDETGGTGADVDLIAADWLVGKIAVEADDTVDFGPGELEP